MTTIEKKVGGFTLYADGRFKLTGVVLAYPTLIKPKNSVIVSFGYKNGNKCLLNKKSYRTLEIYKEFLGEKVFVSCLNESISERPKNWISINGEKYFTKML